jgi:hypothetical protein
MSSRILSIFFGFTTATLGVLLVRAQSPHASQSPAASTQSTASPTPLILEENDGEHRLRRPQGPAGSESVPEFIIKIDKLNGNARGLLRRIRDSKTRWNDPFPQTPQFRRGSHFGRRRRYRNSRR